MEYVNLGNSGLKVSRICLGCMTYGSPATGKLLPGRQPWALSEADSVPFFRQALDLGINFFDTANVYSGGDSEIVVGRFLKANTRRESIVLATKVCSPMREEPNGRGLSRKEIVFELDQSLKRLETDYVDLYQIHRWDYSTPIEETLDALDSLVRAGKVRYLGASSMAAWQFSKALHIAKEHGWHRFIAMQNHYNLIYREEEREMIPLCVDQGVGVIPWSPLARGFFARSRQPESGAEMTKRAQTDDFARNMYFREDDFKVAEAVAQVAGEHGVTPTQIACAWILQAPGVTAPIIGATKTHHLKELFDAVDIRLTAAEVEALEKPYRPHPILGHEQPSAAKMME